MLSTQMNSHETNSEDKLSPVFINVNKCFLCVKTRLPLTPFCLPLFPPFPAQGGQISVPDTVEDEEQSSEGSPSDDLELAVPVPAGPVKFGWIKGVLVSSIGATGD